jgi:hypothetical protein
MRRASIPAQCLAVGSPVSIQIPAAAGNPTKNAPPAPAKTRIGASNSPIDAKLSPLRLGGDLYMIVSIHSS